MKPAKPQIRFQFADLRFSLKERTRLKAFLLHLAEEEGRRVEAVHYIFCTDAYLLEINRSHLNHDTYTDIITFPYSEAGAPLHSDIFISVERVRENALAFDVAFETELYRVMFHGLLHLCGYKDKSKAEVQLMRQREDFWLAAYSRFT